MIHLQHILRLTCLICMFSFFACKNANKPPEKDVVSSAEQLATHTSDNLRKLLSYADKHGTRINDSIQLTAIGLVKSVYENNNFQTIWRATDKWRPIADSLYRIVEHAREYGLYPSDYNYASLVTIRNKLLTDSLSRKDAALWSRADILLTDAYFNIARHLKLGKLGRDSISLRNDSLINDQYFLDHFTRSVSNKNIITSLHQLEPVYPDYTAIKKSISGFLDSADFTPYTYIPYPYKDTLAFTKTLQQRLSEEGVLVNSGNAIDSVTLSAAIMTYQNVKKIKPTGKISESLVRGLNNTDNEKFISIAITLDRYKLMPESPPDTYVLVNLPSFALYVYNKDTLMLTSKTIVGSWKSKTPLLNSKISNFITYPQWTVPYSIIFKEMLPRIQKDINYLYKQRLMVVDKNDSVIDPHNIDWEKLNNKNFPYLIRQREGDDNSLGVIKFNFVNKYSVYLHDTNTRNLFSRSSRALSHGCVRVQDWEALYQFLIRSDTARFPVDTLNAWFSRQEKHTITGFPKVPLFIRYFTVEGKSGRLKFYSDIYGYDRMLRRKYISGKSMS